jgi:hypothetical protein
LEFVSAARLADLIVSLPPGAFRNCDSPHMASMIAGRFGQNINSPQTGNLIKNGSAKLEAVIDSATVSAEGPAATLASEATTLAPPNLVEAKTNNHSRRRVGS